MTDNPCNCDTCPHTNKSKKGMSQDCSKLSHWLLASEYNFVKEMGCLAHPQAQEYLIQDVIKELEKLANGLKYSRDDCDHITAAAYREAIILIKNGVKKE